MGLEIIKYLKALLPHFEKDKILEDLRLTESELEDNVIPSYNAAAQFFSKDKFNSKENEKIEKEIFSYLKYTTSGRGATFLSEFEKRLDCVLVNVGVAINVLNKEIGRDIVTEGVSSKKVVLIRIAERMSYISRNSLDLLNLIYINEAVANNSSYSEIGMSKIEMQKARSSVMNLAKLLNSYGIPSKEFEKNIETAPDLLLSRSDNSVIEATYSDREIEPGNPGFLSNFSGNPIYHIRLLVADFQGKRYKASEEKKAVLQLRLHHLTLIKEKSGINPKLEQEITYTQNRINKIDRYLSEVDASLEEAA